MNSERQTYEQIMVNNLKGLPALGESASLAILEALATIADGQDLILSNAQTNYMTLFYNSTAKYIHDFINDMNNFDAEVDKDVVVGLKHVEKSGVGVMIIVNDKSYFLFPANLVAVDCNEKYQEARI